MADGNLRPGSEPDPLAESASRAAALLKSMAHEGRLMILCALAKGERSVSELEDMLGARQSSVSQQLARLRLEGIVACRREGRSIIYAIADERTARLIEVLHDLFCAPDATADRPGGAAAD